MTTTSSLRLTRNFADSPSEASDYPDFRGAAVLLIDAGRRLIAASAQSLAILDGDPRLSISLGRLTAAERHDAARIDQAIACALGAARGEPWAIFDDGEREVLRIDFTAIHGDLDPPRLVVTLASARIERGRRIAEAVRSYGLTAGEARMLHVMFDGCSVPQAARRLGVAPSTARTHLQRLFDKTGARRQGDLLRLVAAPGTGCPQLA